MLHWIICTKNKNIRKIWHELSSYIHIKLVHPGAPSVLLFLIGKLQDHKVLLKINCTIDFMKMLHWIICSKNKNIRNIWQGVSSFIDMKDRNWLMQELIPSFLSYLGNYRTLQVPPQN